MADTTKTKSKFPLTVKFNQYWEGELDTGKVRFSVKITKPEFKAAKAKGTLPEREVPDEVCFDWLQRHGVINA